IGSITAFIAMMNSEAFDPMRLRTLRKVFSGGAPVQPAVVKRWEWATGVYIHNVWGMTETTSPGTWTPLGERAPVDPETGALSVGRPIPGSEVRIVDPETGQPRPTGEVGEIVVRGPHVFKGYWNKPEETAQTLREGWLYTGDLGKMDTQGWVYWIERRKDIINVSGFKVWPREVEGVLLEHPAVLEAAVIGVPDPYRGETVKAIVVPRPEFRDQVSAEELIAFCRDRLANYKYPRLVEFRDELPKNPQGKILKYVLREEARPADV
ncbi:MAG: AMP-binding protein, partial [Acidobacteria bacterium]|nr:AMP-binding protein [Acidobacteriota bacterium]